MAKGLGLGLVISCKLTETTRSTMVGSEAKNRLL